MQYAHCHRSDEYEMDMHRNWLGDQLAQKCRDTRAPECSDAHPPLVSTFATAAADSPNPANHAVTPSCSRGASVATAKKIAKIKYENKNKRELCESTYTKRL